MGSQTYFYEDRFHTVLLLLHKSDFSALYALLDQRLFRSVLRIGVADDGSLILEAIHLA